MLRQTDRLLANYANGFTPIFNGPEYVDLLLENGYDRLEVAYAVQSVVFGMPAVLELVRSELRWKTDEAVYNAAALLEELRLEVLRPLTLAFPFSEVAHVIAERLSAGEEAGETGDQGPTPGDPGGGSLESDAGCDAAVPGQEGPGGAGAERAAS